MKTSSSRYRTIHCLIWNDDKFPYLSDQGKLVFFLLLTTTFSSPFGAYKAGKAALEEESRMSSKGFREGFDEGLGKGLFKYDEKTRTVFLPKFLKHNKPANPNVVKMWGKVFNEIPEGILKSEIYQVIKECCEGLGEGFAKGFAEGFDHSPAKGMRIQEQEQEQEQDISSSNEDDSQSLAGGGDCQPAGKNKTVCPQQEIRDLYHDILPQCPRMNEWSEKNQAELRTRWREKPERQNLDWWRMLFIKISKSDFLTGKSPGSRGPFLASLGWIVKSANFVKILNDEYKNRKRPERPKPTTVNQELVDQRNLGASRLKQKLTGAGNGPGINTSTVPGHIDASGSDAITAGARTVGPLPRDNQRPDGCLEDRAPGGSTL